jgi:hypothetical protein
MSSARYARGGCTFAREARLRAERKEAIVLTFPAPPAKDANRAAARAIACRDWPTVILLGPMLLLIARRLHLASRTSEAFDVGKAETVTAGHDRTIGLPGTK